VMEGRVSGRLSLKPSLLEHWLRQPHSQPVGWTRVVASFPFKKSDDEIV